MERLLSLMRPSMSMLQFVTDIGCAMATRLSVRTAAKRSTGLLLDRNSWGGGRVGGEGGARFAYDRVALLYEIPPWGEGSKACTPSRALGTTCIATLPLSPGGKAALGAQGAPAAR